MNPYARIQRRILLCFACTAIAAGCEESHNSLNDTCPEGTAFQEETGTCKPVNTTPDTPECDQDNPCPNNKICVDGTCQKAQENQNTACEKDEDCSNGEACIDKFCQSSQSSECQNNICCKENELLIAGTCYDQTACNPACKEGQVCKNGSCFLCVKDTCYLVNNDPDDEPSTCQSDDDCSDTDKCIENTCTTPDDNACTTPCQKGETCVNGTCKSQMLLWALCRNDSDCGVGKCLFTLKPSREMVYQNIKYGIEGNINIPISLLDERINVEYYNKTHEISASENDEIGICATDCTKSKNNCAEGWTCQLVLKGDSPYPTLNTSNNSENDNTVSLPLDVSDNDMKSTGFSAICRPVMTEQMEKETPYGAELCGTNEAKCKAAGMVFFNGMCLESCENAEIECPYMFSCTEVEADDANARVCLPIAGTCAECYDNDGDGAGYGHCRTSGVDCNDNRPDIYYAKSITCADTVNDDNEIVFEDHNCNGIIDRFELIGTTDNCSSCNDGCNNPGPGVAITCDSDRELDEDWRKTATAAFDLPKFTCNQQCAFGFGDCDNNAQCKTKLISTEKLEAAAVTAVTEAAAKGEQITTAEAAEILKNEIRASWIRSTPELNGKAASIAAADNDEDNYPTASIKLSQKAAEIVLDPDNTVICCGSKTKDGGKTCYSANQNWTTVSRPDGYKTINDASYTDAKSYDIDDNDKTINPEAIEKCDGIDNDGSTILLDGKENVSCDEFCSSPQYSAICNTLKKGDEYLFNPFCDATPDGSKEPVPFKDTVSNVESAFGQSCDIRNESTHDVCNHNGIARCDAANGALFCNGTTDGTVKDGIMNNNIFIDGIDDNCNGKKDEDAIIPCLLVDENQQFFDDKNNLISYVSNKDCKSSNSLCKFIPFVTEASYSDILNATLDSSYPSVRNPDGSINLCRLGVVIPRYDDKLKIPNSSNYHPTCTPLFQPRKHDFYGDGIDSNCDGYDYDINHTVFISHASQGTTQASDKNTCLFDKETGYAHPCKTFARAFEVAAVDGIYTDIFVTNDELSIDNTIEIPIVSSFIKPNNFKTLSETKKNENGEIINDKHIISPYRLHQRLIEEYNAKGNVNEYLYTYDDMSEDIHGKKTYTTAANMELNQRDEYVRIYGGFEAPKNANTPWQTSSNQTKITYTLSAITKNTHALIAQKNNSNANARASLYIDNMDFTMSSSVRSDNRKGTTFVGFNFPAGASTLTLSNVSMNITAPNGKEKFDSRADDGFTGNNGKTGNSGKLNAIPIPSSAQRELCTAANETQTPRGGRGGCGGFVRDEAGVRNEYYHNTGTPGEKGFDTNGQANGGDGGDGATGSSCDHANTCTSGSVDSKKPVGKGGKGGKPGTNGTYQDTLFFTYTNTSFYVDSNPDSGNGTDGLGGGGGGGGLVYQAYERDNQDEHRTVAGAGGSGGNGGKGGNGGYTGGSAIGLFIANSKSLSANISFEKVTVKTTNGSGGEGQNGGYGGNGGNGGNKHGFRETTATICNYCEKATNGAGGGGGGAGGNGAYGHVGFSYPFVFACNDSLSASQFTDKNLNTLANCGFHVTQGFINAPKDYGIQNLTATYRNQIGTMNQGNDAQTGYDVTAGGAGGEAESKFSSAVVDTSYHGENGTFVRLITK